MKALLFLVVAFIAIGSSASAQQQRYANYGQYQNDQTRQRQSYGYDQAHNARAQAEAQANHDRYNAEIQAERDRRIAMIQAEYDRQIAMQQAERDRQIAYQQQAMYDRYLPSYNDYPSYAAPAYVYTRRVYVYPSYYCEPSIRIGFGFGFHINIGGHSRGYRR